MANIFQTPNATEVNVDIVGSSTFGIYPKISSAKTYNCFISDDWMISFPGYIRMKDLADEGEGRGLFHSVRGNFMIAVVNNKVYRISTALGTTEIGTIRTTRGEVYIAENLSSQICIVDGASAWIYYYLDTPNLTEQVIPSDLLPNFVRFHNSYFLIGNGLTNNNGSKWFSYERASDTTITEANEFALQTKPDFALAVERIPGQSSNVLVFGRSVAEVWSHVGGEQNYRRNNTISVDSGCISVSTIASSEDAIFWLGINETNAPVIMMYKEGAQQISTDGISNLMQSIVEPEKSTACIYRQDGHLFYQLTFYGEEDNVTIAYDANTQKFYHLSDWKLDYHPAREIVYFNNTWYFISIQRPSLYEINTSINVIDESLNEVNDDDFIHPIQRIRQTSPIRTGNSSRYRINSLVVTMEQGMDGSCAGVDLTDYIVMEDDTTDIITTEQGVFLITETSQTGYAAEEGCPRIDLSFSKDGGITWSNTVGRELRGQAHRKNILSWRNFGVANDLTFKVKYFGLTRFVINNAVAQVY